MDGEPLRDRYLVQLWPAPAALDTVVRETSESAAYWHECARTSPTPEQLAEVKRQKQLAKEEAAREATRAAEERRWSGPPPSERLRRTNGASIMAGLARDLIDRMDNADAATQRAVAIWAAHQACAMAGLSDLDWVAAALAALDRGEPPFASVDQAFELLRNDSRVRFTTIRSYDGRHDRVSRQYMALPAVWAAAADDPLAAGMEALFHAVVTAGSEYPDLVAEARRAFIPR